MYRMPYVNRRHRKAGIKQCQLLTYGGYWLAYSAKAGYYSSDWVRRLRRRQLAAGDGGHFT